MDLDLLDVQGCNSLEMLLKLSRTCVTGNYEEIYLDLSVEILYYSDNDVMNLIPVLQQ